MTSPAFFLYGEPARTAGRDFLHVEPLDARSRPADWRIRTHHHDDLHQLFMLTSGAGEMRSGCSRVSLAAPCVLLVPAGSEHAFRFVPDTTGRVLTLSQIFFDALCRFDDALTPLLAAPRALALGTDAEIMLGHLDRLGHELAWHAPGHTAAVKATLLQILVIVLRLETHGALLNGAESADARLVARFRELVEARFRTHAPVGRYATALGVSLSRLRQACRAQGCGAPLDIVRARQMLEAKRGLLYGRSTIAELAASLGYEDVSYFIRSFRRREGSSPGAFRASSRPAP